MKEFSYEEVEAATGSFAEKNLVGKGSHGNVYRAKLRGRGSGGRTAVARAGRSQARQRDRRSLRRAAPPWRRRHRRGRRRRSAAQAGGHHRGGGGGPASASAAAACPGVHSQRVAPPVPSPAAVAAPRGDRGRRGARRAGAPRRRAARHHSPRRQVRQHPARPRRPRPPRRLQPRRQGLRRWRRNPNRPRRRGRGGSGAGGHDRYLDPCYTEPDRLGPASDVFSFGVVLLELVSGRKVMDVNASPSSIVSWATPLVAAGQAREVLHVRVPGPLTPRAEDAVARVLAVAARCVSESVDRLPGMAEVVAEISGAIEGAGWRHGRGPRGVVENVRRRVVAWGKHVRRVRPTTKVECTGTQQGSLCCCTNIAFQQHEQCEQISRAIKKPNCS